VKYIETPLQEKFIQYFFVGLFAAIIILKCFGNGYCDYQLLPFSPTDICALLVIFRPLYVKY
jgi:hypothetical protein